MCLLITQQMTGLCKNITRGRAWLNLLITFWAQMGPGCGPRNFLLTNALHWFAMSLDKQQVVLIVRGAPSHRMYTFPVYKYHVMCIQWANLLLTWTNSCGPTSVIEDFTFLEFMLTRM